MPIQRFVMYVGGDTNTITSITPDFFTYIHEVLTLPNKPFILRKAIVKTHWFDYAQNNIDTNPGNTIGKFLYEATLSWVLYKEDFYTGGGFGAFKKPDVNLPGSPFWPYDTSYLIDYGILVCHLGTTQPYTYVRNVTTQENGIFLPNFVGTALPLAWNNAPPAPVVGTAGPFTLTPSTNIPAHNLTTTARDLVSFSGGTTYDKSESCIEDLDLSFDGSTQQRIIFVGTYAPIEFNVNIGKRFRATIELYLEF
jgi:hypothetical protein